ISGGGRCNFTNLDMRPAHYLSQNPRFCISALKRFTPADFIAMLKAHGIAWHEKTGGQLFCEGSAGQIVDMLYQGCLRAGVQIETGCQIHHVSRSRAGFELDSSTGRHISQSLVIATGGPSIPDMGATGFGYEIARQFALNVITPRPALVPLALAPELLQRIRALAGISAQVEASCGKARFAEALLFTHRGLSGPAILQISSYWQEGAGITINFAPGLDVSAFLKAARQTDPRQAPQTALAALMPKRLARFLCEEAGVSGNLGALSNKNLQKLAAIITCWRITPAGTEGFRTAEVTLGGVDTRALSSKTFEARAVPGLYFIGEVVDVTGHLGGYNFQWAWASGHAAGQYV
ncbi:MAG TPA: aminoacetone oxidase family FAD-binding enzyme, partial [Rhizobiales bacterium]|nr:aminoacetone oxidase family FAD-binding enzyme [Hyphomicrobiales bacterium]